MGKSAPKPTPPRETAAAQTSTNVSTAIANSYLGNISEYGPDGSTRVEQTGMKSVFDPFTGKTYEIPQFSRYTELSPEQQRIKTQQDAASLNLATLGNNLSGQLGEKLTGNFEIGNEAVESRLFDLGSKRLDPKFERERESLQTQLINRGIREGTDAWNAAMGNFNEGRNDAYNQLLLTGRGQAVQEQLAEDNQRINQISALLSGGQVSQPNFMGANMPTIPTTDTAGIIANADAQELQAWQQKQAGLGGLFGGLMGLGAAGIYKYSDKRLKKDIKKVGKTEDGLGVYKYRYKGEAKSAPLHLGLMAQEVEKKKPSAVAEDARGLKMVDYGKALSLGAR